MRPVLFLTLLGGALVSCSTSDRGTDASVDARVFDDIACWSGGLFPYGPCEVEGSTRCEESRLYVCGAGCWRTPLGPCEMGDAGTQPDTSELLDAALDPIDAEPDAPAGPIDAGGDAPAIADAGVPATMTYCVDIDVSNTCEMTVSPTEITIPADQIAYFCWRNRSADYPVDVWLSYGGGYTDLAPGATWNEPPGHCLGPLAHDEYADISTACSDFRFLIHCL